MWLKLTARLRRWFDVILVRRRAQTRMQFPRFEVPPEQFVDDRDEEESKESRYQQATDHSVAEGRVLLSVVTEPKTRLLF